MADRTVSVQLRANVKPYTSGMVQAAAATSLLRDEIAEAETAHRRLRAEMSKALTLHANADTRQATRKLDDLSAMADTLEADTITLSADADVYDAMRDLRRLADELDTLDGRTVRARADLDATAAMKTIDMLGREKVPIDVDLDAAKAKLGDFSQSVGGAVAAGARAGGPALITALGGLAATVGPIAGAAIGGALVAGIGGRLVALGTQSLFFVAEVDKSWSAAEKRRVEAANRQAKELQKQFTELGRDLNLELQEASRPMLSVLDQVRITARDVAKDVGPNLAAGFDQARLPLEKFVREAGAGLKALGDSIPSLMGGFGDVVDQLDIRGFLSDLGREFDELGRVVSENRSSIGAVLNGLLDVIPLAIDGIGKVVDFFGKMGLAVMRSAATISEHMAGVTSVITGVGTRVLDVVRTIGQALSNVPGMEDLGAKIVEGADAGIKKLQEFQKIADEASRSVRLKADITELQQNIDKALTELDDPNITKERKAQLTAEIDRLLTAKSEALVQLGDPKLVSEYKSAITTDIVTLQSRLAEARKELKDPELTKERKSRLKAEIGELEEGVRRAKLALDTVIDKTVTIRVRTEIQEHGARASWQREADGGIHRYAAGGIRAAQGMKLRPQPPQIVSRPTVLFGEGSSGFGGTEAFIPYEARFRPRAIELLGQVADDFGLSLYNRQAAATMADFSETALSSSQQVGMAIDSAVDQFAVSLGQSGILPGALDQVGQVGREMATTWESGSELMSSSVTVTGSTISTSVTSMGKAVNDSVVSLGRQMADLQKMINSARESQSAGMIAGHGPKKKGSGLNEDTMIAGHGPKKNSGYREEFMIEGHAPALGSGGIVTRPMIALVGERAREAVIPLDSPQGRAMLGGGGPVNSSRVSRPQQVPSRYAYSGGGDSWSGGSGSGPGGASVSFINNTFSNDVDVDVMTAKVSMAIDKRA